MNTPAIRRPTGRVFGPWIASLGVILLAGAGGPALGQVVHEGESFEVIDASHVPTAASTQPTGDEPSGDEPSGEFAQLEQLGEAKRDQAASRPIGELETRLSETDLSGTDLSGIARSGGSSCRSCGPSGGGYGLGAGGGTACPSCNPFWYATVEGLYMRRFGNRRFSLAQDFRLDEFNYEWAPRVTVGMVPDCVQGFEVGFTGVLRWNMRNAASSAGNELDTLLLADGTTVAPDSLDTFSGAQGQSQSYDADFWSVEGNRVFHGWGVSKILYGLRYIDYSEDFRYMSVHPTEGSGLLRSDTRNRMIGGQVGLDLLYPVGRYAYADFRGRAGAYLNLAKSRVDLINGGSRILASRPDDESLAGLAELSTGLRYELGESLSIRGGVEAWYMAGVASARDQIRRRVTNRLGRRLDDNDDIFILGLTVGAEFKY